MNRASEILRTYTIKPTTHAFIGKQREERGRKNIEDVMAENPKFDFLKKPLHIHKG